eukprot:jgi/Bigna1/81747/fgenesh1_pg.83_\
MAADLAVQDLIGPHANGCYGCGPYNEKGLKLKSYWVDEENNPFLGSCHATFVPDPSMNGGHPNVTYGGILACIVDCHSMNTAMAYLYRKQGLSIGDKSIPQKWCVTKSLKLDYKRPTPVSAIKLTARVTGTKRNRRIVFVETLVQTVSTKGKAVLTVKGHAVAVSISGSNAMNPHPKSHTPKQQQPQSKL